MSEKFYEWNFYQSYHQWKNYQWKKLSVKNVISEKGYAHGKMRMLFLKI